MEYNYDAMKAVLKCVLKEMTNPMDATGNLTYILSGTIITKASDQKFTKEELSIALIRCIDEGFLKAVNSAKFSQIRVYDVTMKGNEWLNQK